MNDADYLTSQHKRLAKLIRKRTGEKHTTILRVVKKFDIFTTRRQIQEELARRDRPMNTTEFSSRHIDETGREGLLCGIPLGMFPRHASGIWM